MASSTYPMPKPAGRSRFSKALPAPPPLVAHLIDSFALPSLREGPLAARPPLPLKDATVGPIIKKLPMDAKLAHSPLPRPPASTRMDRPPPAMLKRKPVGSCDRTPSPPPPPPVHSGETSPANSICSLLSAYGTEASSGTRYSAETTATKDSSIEEYVEPSPKILHNRHLPGRGAQLDMIPPSSSVTISPSAEMIRDAQSQPVTVQQKELENIRAPTPPAKDSQRLASPISSKATSAPKDATSNSPTSVSSQLPSQSKLWRRRSLKSDKPLTAPVLNLSSSHGSTTTSSLPNDTPLYDLSSMLTSQPAPRPACAIPGSELPCSKDVQSLPGCNTKPSASNKDLPNHPYPEPTDNMKSKLHLDRSSPSARDIDRNTTNDRNKISELRQASPPDLCGPLAPDSSHAEIRLHAGIPKVASSASPESTVTLSTDGRPLSMIYEDSEHHSHSANAGPPPGGQQSALPLSGGNSSRSGRLDLPRTPAPASAHHSSTATTSVTAVPYTVAAEAGDSNTALRHNIQSPSPTSIPSMHINEDDHGATTQAIDSTSSPSSSLFAQQLTNTSGPDSPTGSMLACPTNANYFPKAQYSKVYAQGDIIPAPLIKEAQLDCLSNHFRFVFSRNQDHPVACMACRIEDRALRFTCAHCSVRVCGGCRDMLATNGRDLRKLADTLNVSRTLSS